MYRAIFSDALAYPIRGHGWVMILIGAVFSAVLDLLQHAPLFGLVVALFSAGYFGGFYLDIVNVTMTGGDQVPDWPSFSDFTDDILTPALRLAAINVLSFAPLVVAFILISPSLDAPWAIPLLGGMLLYAAFYFPMAVLGAQGFGGVRGALPDIVWPAVIRTLPGYLLVVAALAVGFVVSVLAKVLAGGIPYVGWMLTAALALYSLMFQGRLIGLIYRIKSDQLAW